MRDIVATIQPEQDELVRAELDETICVQGAPGTGKTAVGLHRAAYLLYQHRERLRRAGVLVVGPNLAFLRYISAVLPALGEIDVEQVARRRPRRPGAGARHRPGRRRRPQAGRPAGRGAGPGAAARIGRPTDGLVVSDGVVAVADLGRGAAPHRGRRTPRAAPVRASAANGYGPGRWPCCSGRPRRAGATRRRSRGCAAWAATRRCGRSSTRVWPATTARGARLRSAERPGRPGRGGRRRPHAGRAGAAGRGSVHPGR